jgi:hypothetical protein
MEQIALLGFALRFLYATAGLLGTVVTFRWLNKLAGNQFDEAFAGITREPHAAALYFGLRALGVFVYYGMILG